MRPELAVLALILTASTAQALAVLPVGDVLAPLELPALDATRSAPAAPSAPHARVDATPTHEEASARVAAPAPLPTRLEGVRVVPPTRLAPLVAFRVDARPGAPEAQGYAALVAVARDARAPALVAARPAGEAPSVVTLARPRAPAPTFADAPTVDVPPQAAPATPLAASEDAPVASTTVRVATTLLVAAAASFVLVFPLALYHRLRGRHVLESGARSRLHDALRDAPGASAAQLARAVGLHLSTALYHLRRLQKESLVVEDGERWFLAGAAPAHERERLVAQREGAALLELVRRTPGATKTQLAQAAGLPRSTLSWQLARLERAGLVATRPEGRVARVFPT